MFDVLTYEYQSAGFILLAIPETCFEENSSLPIWGSHNGDLTSEVYVLPEYVYVYVNYVSRQQIKEDKYGYKEGLLLQKKIIKNDDLKEQYKFFFESNTGKKILRENLTK